MLWEKVKKVAGLTKEEFDLYYQNSNFGVGIFMKDRHITALSLDEVRQRWPHFRPPQSFHYLKDNEVCLAGEFSDFCVSP